MNKNYMIYPLKNMRITCRYDEGSHKEHNENVADYKDYPIDDAGIDTGKDPIYCPCDEMKVVAIRGLNNSQVTNTVWLVSTSQVITPTFVDRVFMTLTHSDDADLQNIYVGKTFKRGDIITYEGKDGASANHIHIVCGKGYADTWIENSNHKWVIKGNSAPPEEIFFVDRNFTHVLNSGNLNWEYLKEEKIDIIGNPVNRDTSINQVEVLINNLNLRESPTTTSKRIGYIKRGIYNVLDTTNNEGYVWYKVENYWIATNDSWTKYYPKSEVFPKLIFTCDKTGKYLIYLEKGNKLYLNK